jgi:putative transposase
MGRPQRTLVPGGVYHVTARGTGPIEIYRDDVDRRCFMHWLATVERRFAWIRRALCLMGTHYHLLVETREPNLSAGMHQLNGLYARLFNTRHSRVGALFQSRFHATLVESQEHVDAAVHYIAANPVRAGSAPAPRTGSGPALATSRESRR